MRARLDFIKLVVWVYSVSLITSSPRTSTAAEWAALPSLRVAGQYNDNIRLTPLPHTSVHGSTISPNLDLSVSSEIWQVRGGIRASRVRYPGDSTLNSDDRFYNLAASYQLERSTFQLTGSRAETTFFTELQVTPDTGLVQVQQKYDTYNINPSWTWAIDELTQMQVAYSLTNISYVNGEYVGLYNYTARDASAQLTRSIDPRDQVFFSAAYSTFNVPSTTFSSDSTTFQAGLARNFSDTLRATFYTGRRRAMNEQDVSVCSLYVTELGCLQFAPQTVSSRQSGVVYNGSLEKNFEVTRLSLTVNRSYDPSGRGGVVRSDSQIASFSRKFTSRLTATFDAGNYNYAPYTGNLSDASVKRHFYYYRPDLSWAWTRDLNLNVAYQYSHIKRASDNQPAASNAVFLTIGYQFPRMAISR